MAFDIAMCDPHNFSIEYRINPWMTPYAAEHKHSACTRARAQWQRLYDRCSRMVDVTVCKSQPKVPDMVFFGNAGLLINNTFVLPRFTYEERKAEEPHLAQWAASEGLDIVKLPDTCRFEGEADALVDVYRGVIWGGSEFRSTRSAHQELRKVFDIPVLSLTMINNYFYHLDTCLSPLSNGVLMYYPKAFDKRSLEVIEAEVSQDMRLAVSDEDSRSFACNAVQIHNTVFVNNMSEHLTERLMERNIHVVRIPLDEFLKSGGGAKCLVLTRYVL